MERSSLKPPRSMDLWHQNENNRKSYNEIDAFGNISNCSPLVFEHFGHWGWRAHQFLQELSELSVDKNGQKNGRDFKAF